MREAGIPGFFCKVNINKSDCVFIFEITCRSEFVVIFSECGGRIVFCFVILPDVCRIPYVY